MQRNEMGSVAGADAMGRFPLYISLQLSEEEIQDIMQIHLIYKHNLKLPQNKSICILA